jgi:galactokinase
LALQLTEIFIRRNNLQGKAASRVHGGGFAGVIQVYLPRKFAAPYKDYMANVFGGNVFIMAVRPCGVIEVSG